MTKKDYILQFLSHLSGWSVSNNLQHIVEQIEDQTTLEKFFIIIKNIVITVNNESIEEKYIDMMKKVRELEGEETKLDEFEILELEEELYY